MRLNLPFLTAATLFVCVIYPLGSARAQGLDLLGGPLRNIPFVRLQGLEMPPSDDGLSEESVHLSTPVFKSDKQSLSASFKYLRLTPSQDRGLLRDYYNVEGALSYARPLASGDSWSLAASYGSASDKAFASSSVSTISGTYTYTYAAEGAGQWIFLVNYSNNRPILNNIPLPGFAYLYRPSPQFFGVFGAPFATFNWQFTEKWSWGFLSFVPWVLKTNLTYKIAGPIQAYSGLDIAQSTFLREGRERRQDRVYFDDRKIMFGIKSPVHRFVMADLEMGHAFSRRLFESEEFKLQIPGETKLTPENYVRLSLMIFLSDPAALRPPSKPAPVTGSEPQTSTSTEKNP